MRVYTMDMLDVLLGCVTVYDIVDIRTQIQLMEMEKLILVIYIHISINWTIAESK